MKGPCFCGHGIAMHQHKGREGDGWCRRKTCSCARYRPTFGLPARPTPEPTVPEDHTADEEHADV